MRIAPFKKILRDHKTFLLSTHVNPDPDALSSELAMAVFLRQQGKTVHIVNEEVVPERFEFLPGSEKIKVFKEGGKLFYDAAIILDCGDLQRIGKVEHMLDPNKPVVNMDHHITNDKFGDVNIVEPESSSTTELLYEVFVKCGVTMNKTLASLLYMGIMTDTGNFRYNNTTSKTHHIAAELLKHDFSAYDMYCYIYERIPLEDFRLFSKLVSEVVPICGGKVILVDLKKAQVKKFSEFFDLRDAIFKSLRKIDGAEVFVIFTEDKRQLTRVNFRSGGRVDVAKLAHHFDGGGHHNASGCTVKMNMKEAREVVFKAIEKVL